MNTTFLNIRTDTTLKEQAAKIADDLGFSLSTLVNAYLKHFVKTKTVHFEEKYEPTPHLKRSIKRTMEDIKTGKNLSPGFNNAKDAIAYLHDKMK